MTVEVHILVHKSVPACCRKTLLKFGAQDRYRGAGEPGDKVKCACGNWLVYEGRGWGLTG